MIEERQHIKWVNQLAEFSTNCGDEKTRNLVLLEPGIFRLTGWQKPDIVVIDHKLQIIAVIEVNISNPYETCQPPTVLEKVQKIRQAFGEKMPIFVFEPVEYCDKKLLTRGNKAAYAREFNLKPEDITSYAQVQQFYQEKWKIPNFKFWNEKNLNEARDFLKPKRLEICWLCKLEIEKDQPTDIHHNKKRVGHKVHTLCHRAINKRVFCIHCGKMVLKDRREHLKKEHFEKFGHMTMEQLMKEYPKHFDFMKSKP